MHFLLVCVCTAEKTSLKVNRSFTRIDAENQEEHFVELHWAVNDMDNFPYETDVYSPEEFYKVVREMEKDNVFQP